VQNRMLRAAVAIAAIGFVAACAAESPTPAAVNGVASDAAAANPDSPKQAPVTKREARQIVVHAGQSLSRIAAEYGTSQRTIIAANDLTPPYKIKIGQQLLVPSADEPLPAPAVAGSPQPEIIPLDRPALARSTASPPTAAMASPAPPPVVPAAKPFEAAPAVGNSPEPLRAPVVPTATTASAAPSGTAEPPAPATTAAAPSPTPVPAAAPPGVTCPSGTMGMWSEDIIKKPVYICRKLGSPS
jgi:LysM repeat protein